MNAKIGVLRIFLAILACETHFKSELRLKSNEIDTKELRMKFSELNVVFDDPSLDFLGSRKPVHEGIKEWYLRTVKVVILPLLAIYL